MKVNNFLLCLFGIVPTFGCSTSRTTYEVSDPYIVTSIHESRPILASSLPRPVAERPIENPVLKSRSINVLDREPDVVSQHPKVTFDYPERDRPGLYQVINSVNVRDFPSMHGKIIGTLRPGETVTGNEIEGPWIRIYANSYTSLKSLKRIK